MIVLSWDLILFLLGRDAQLNINKFEISPPEAECLFETGRQSLIDSELVRISMLKLQ